MAKNVFYGGGSKIKADTLNWDLKMDNSKRKKNVVTIHDT